MIHYMELNPQPFYQMACGVKTIELRLNDEKRQNIKINDIILFSNVSNQNEQITVRVVNLYNYCNFVELYQALPLDKCGYSTQQLFNASPKDMEVYYSIEKQNKYGVLGIEVQLMNM